MMPFGATSYNVLGTFDDRTAQFLAFDERFDVIVGVRARRIPGTRKRWSRKIALSSSATAAPGQRCGPSPKLIKLRGNLRSSIRRFGSACEDTSC
jgi:hypothetical protein